MHAITTRDILTERLVLRTLAAEHADAFWPVLRDPALYRWIARPPPVSLADLKARFDRIAQRTAVDRAGQWVNWTVWTRGTNTALGVIETTVPPSGPALIAYMFASTIWRNGYATEAMRAALAALADAGVVVIEATIDTRNTASRALVAKLGFSHFETRSSDDIIDGAPTEEDVWRCGVANAASR